MPSYRSRNTFSITKALVMAKDALFKHFWVLFLAEAFMILGIRQIAEFFPGMLIFNAINGLNDSMPILIVHRFFPNIEVPQLSKDLNELVTYLSAGVMAPLCLGGAYGLLLSVMDCKPARFSDLFSKKHLFWRYLFSHLLLAVVFALNMLVTMIPFLFAPTVKALPLIASVLAAIGIGIAIVATFSFHPLLIVDQNLSLKDSLLKSFSITKGIRIKLFAFFTMLLVIAIVIAAPALVFVALVGSLLEKSNSIVNTILGTIYCAAMLPAPLFWKLCWAGCYRQLVKNEVSAGTLSIQQEKELILVG
jgi:hypothetical protein